MGMAPPAMLHLELARGCNRITVPPEVGGIMLHALGGYMPGDERLLGALIAGLRVDGAAIDLDDPRLGRGFYPTEQHGQARARWTGETAHILLPPRVESEIWEIEINALTRVEQYWPARNRA